MKKGFLAVFAIFTLASCSTVRYISEDTTIALPSNVSIAEPLVSIDIIDGIGKSAFSDSLTVMAIGSTEFALNENSDISPVSSVVTINDEQYGDLFSAVAFLAKTEFSKKELRNLIVPDAVLDFMKDHNLQQAGFLMETGFERTKDNIKKELIIDVVLAVVTAVVSMGSVVNVPVTTFNYDEYSFVVVDASSQKLLYRNTTARESHTYDNDSSKAMLRKLFADYSSSLAGRQDY